MMTDADLDTLIDAARDGWPLGLSPEVALPLLEELRERRQDQERLDHYKRLLGLDQERKDGEHEQATTH